VWKQLCEWLCLFRVLLDACPFYFLQYAALPAFCNGSPFLFSVCVVKCPSPTLQWSMPHFSCCWKPSLLQAHWGRCAHPPSPASLFIYILHGELPLSPLQWSFPHDSHCYKLSPLKGCWMCAATPAFSGQLVYLQFV
jgi:hypothetical protein